MPLIRQFRLAARAIGMRKPFDRKFTEAPILDRAGVQTTMETER